MDATDPGPTLEVARPWGLLHAPGAGRVANLKDLYFQKMTAFGERKQVPF
jgi:hypothetical protein